MSEQCCSILQYIDLTQSGKFGLEHCLHRAQSTSVRGAPLGREGPTSAPVSHERGHFWSVAEQTLAAGFQLFHDVARRGQVHSSSPPKCDLPALLTALHVHHRYPHLQSERQANFHQLLRARIEKQKRFMIPERNHEIA